MAKKNNLGRKKGTTNLDSHCKKIKTNPEYVDSLLSFQAMAVLVLKNLISTKEFSFLNEETKEEINRTVEISKETQAIYRKNMFPLTNQRNKL
jgi:hypothetical protein